MYGLMNHEMKVVALHDKKEVVLKYQKRYKETNDEELRIFKIKKDKIKKYKSLERDLYLVRYGKTYVPLKYFYIKELDVDPLIDDLRMTKDVLIRMIEFSNNQKEVKVLDKTCAIIEDEIEKLEKTTDSIEYLKDRDSWYDEMKQRYPY